MREYFCYIYVGEFNESTGGVFGKNQKFNTLAIGEERVVIIQKFLTKYVVGR